MSSLKSFLERKKAKYIGSDISTIDSVIKEKELKKEFFLNDDVCFSMATSSVVIPIILALLSSVLIPIDYKIIRGATFFGVLITTVIGLIAFHSLLSNFIFKINKNSRAMYRCKEKIFKASVMKIENVEEMTKCCDENMFKKFLIFADKKPTYEKLEAFIIQHEQEPKMIEANTNIDDLVSSLYNKEKMR